MTGFTLHKQSIDRERVTSAVAVVAVHVALGWAFLTGLGVSLPDKAQEVLATFNVVSPPPPPIPPPPPPRPMTERAPKKEGAAAPPNLKSRATEVVAPVTPVPIPPPITVAPLPAVGVDPSSGNAERAGPGIGSGGIGIGTGSGRYGDGDGGGGGGGRPARLVKRGLGSLSCGTPEQGCPSREVGIRFVVQPDGYATNCIVTASSGDRRTDDETCRRIERRLRYDPARDRDGRKIAQVINGSQYWESIVAEPDDPDPNDDRD